jgi:HSP20 family protein
MSSIEIRKQNENRPLHMSDRTLDPLRAIRALLSWDPFGEMVTLPAASERSFSGAPAFDVKETKDGYEFKADVPGIQDKDLDVTMTGNRLTVSGKREAEKDEKSDRYYTYERSYGSFTRSFTLPDGTDTDKLSASLEKGVLTLIVPKKPEVQAKRIAVRTEGQTNKS